MLQIDERTVGEGMADKQPDAGEIGWFVARQPGIVRFLEERLFGEADGDAFGVALEAALRICRVFEKRDGLAPERLRRSLLERAEEAVMLEARSSNVRDGCAARQPELVRTIARLLSRPPTPLRKHERNEIGMALLAVVYALDEVTTGRQVP
jgi:hypothetical protein